MAGLSSMFAQPPGGPHPYSFKQSIYEYERRGAAHAFCAVEPKAGQHFVWPTPNRCGAEFAVVLGKLAIHYSDADTIHLVMDNLSTHSRKSLTEFYGEEIGTELWNRFTIHYTPVHGIWLNQAEIEISLFSRQCLGHRRTPDLNSLEQQAAA